MMASQEEMLAREIGGVANALHGRAFQKHILENFFNAPTCRVEIDRNVDCQEPLMQQAKQFSRSNRAKGFRLSILLVP